MKMLSSEDQLEDQHLLTMGIPERIHDGSGDVYLHQRDLEGVCPCATITDSSTHLDFLIVPSSCC